VQTLDHPAIDRHNALALVLRQVESGNHLASLFNLGLRGREGFVARLNLAGMNKCLAIKTEFDALGALVGKAIGVSDVILNAVENIDAIDACGSNTGRQPGQHRRPARHKARARILGKIVGAHHETGQARLGITRR